MVLTCRKRSRRASIKDRRFKRNDLKKIITWVPNFCWKCWAKTSDDIFLRGITSSASLIRASSLHSASLITLYMRIPFHLSSFHLFSQLFHFFYTRLTLFMHSFTLFYIHSSFFSTSFTFFF